MASGDDGGRKEEKQREESKGKSKKKAEERGARARREQAEPRLAPSPRAPGAGEGSLAPRERPPPALKQARPGHLTMGALRAPGQLSRAAAGLRRLLLARAGSSPGRRSASGRSRPTPSWLSGGSQGSRAGAACAGQVVAWRQGAAWLLGSAASALESLAAAGPAGAPSFALSSRRALSLSAKRALALSPAAPAAHALSACSAR